MQNLIQDKYFTDLLTPYHHIYKLPNGNSIYLGSQSSVGGFPDKWNYNEKDFNDIHNDLISKNIKSIVCCADLYDLFDDFSYLHVPMESNDNFDIYQPCKKAWKFIDESLEKNSVIVHCNAGCHRSATVVIGYISKLLNISVSEAIEFVKSKRSCIEMNNFKDKLEKILIDLFK